MVLRRSTVEVPVVCATGANPVGLPLVPSPNNNAGEYSTTVFEVFWATKLHELAHAAGFEPAFPAPKAKYPLSAPPAALFVFVLSHREFVLLRAFHFM